MFAPRQAGTSCADGDDCDGAEYCDGDGSCEHAAPLDCNDGKACTDDACDPTSGCVF